MNHNSTNIWHSLKFEEVIEAFESNQTGLTTEQVQELIKEYGTNELPTKKGISWIAILIRQFVSPLIFILLLGAGVSLWLNEEIDALVIGLIIAVNAAIGFWQEYKAEKAIESLSKIEAQNAVVLRNGKQHTIDSKDLVPGDILVLAAGNKIAADARLIEANSLQVDESILTGESLSVTKAVHPLEVNTPLADRNNMVYTGTTITEGRGTAIVTGTAQNTEIGKIAYLVQSEAKEQTPLQKRINKLSKGISIISIALALFVAVIALWQDRTLYETFQLAISFAVAAVPEGLPVVVTITLSLGVKRMLKQNALIRRLPVVEVLGNADVFCTDKTGTLTTDEMVVDQIVTASKVYKFESNSNESFIETQSSNNSWSHFDTKLPTQPLEEKTQLNDILTKLVLASDATTTIGDPTETSLIVAAENIGIDYKKVREDFKRTDEVPFSSEYKFMITQNANDGIVIKGSAEAVLAKSTLESSDGKSSELSEKRKEELLQVVNDLAGQGYRVLGLAHTNDTVSGNLKDFNNFTFLAIVALVDPPRKEAKQAIEDCKKAGIRVIMITGDHALTAKAIAEKVGIDADNVLEGKNLDRMTDQDMRSAVKQTSIFARVTSEHKLKILKALQANGNVVGMGGDGVNDAPAIKKAEIGFAVNNGTDLTKEVADMILLDSNFATVPKAVKEGRVIFQNIGSFIKLMLSSNFDELLLVMTSIVMQIPLIFVPIQILWINLLSDGLPATALALDKGQPEIMNSKPRTINRQYFKNIYLFTFLAGIFAYAMIFFVFSNEYNWWANPTEEDLDRARTMAFVGSVLFEAILVYMVRTKNFAFGKGAFNNKWLIAAIVSSLTLLMMAVYIPFLNPIFKTVPLSADKLVEIVLAVLVATGLLEAFKIWYYKKRLF